MSRSKLLVFFALTLLMSVPAGLAQAQDASVLGSGTAIISDGEAAGDTITYAMTDVTQPADGMVYVGWLVSDDGSIKLNTGVLTVESDGSVSGSFVSPDGENFINTYNKVVITSEEEANADAAEPAGEAVFSHVVPEGAIAHIRHLLTARPPTDSGILADLKNQLKAAITHANLARSSDTIEDIINHTHHVINIIEGEGGANFDSGFANPGDGIGVLTHAQNRKHAGFAAGEASDDIVIAKHAALVEEFGKNAEDRATEARAFALVVLHTTSVSPEIFQEERNAQALLSAVTGPLDAALNGIEVTGEFGANAAYIEAQMMAIYSIEPVAPTPTPTPTATPTATPTPTATNTGGGQTGGLGIGLPGVGDSAIPMLAQVGLIAALVFLGAGGIVLLRGRRARTNS